MKQKWCKICIYIYYVMLMHSLMCNPRYDSYYKLFCICRHTEKKLKLQVLLQHLNIFKTLNFYHLRCFQTFDKGPGDTLSYRHTRAHARTHSHVRGKRRWHQLSGNALFHLSWHGASLDVERCVKRRWQGRRRGRRCEWRTGGCDGSIGPDTRPSARLPLLSTTACKQTANIASLFG